MTVLIVVLWLAVGEIVAAGAFGARVFEGCRAGRWRPGSVRGRAIQEATRPYVHAQPALGPFGTPVHLFLATALLISALLNGVAVAMVRVWNPSREARGERREERGEGNETNDARMDGEVAATPSLCPQTRRVWDNPIIWREIRTWAYGRKLLVVRVAYLVLFGLAAASLCGMIAGGPATAQSQASLALAPFLLLSLVLVNAQAVTSLTSERDVGALDLLLVTDLTPKEIVYGKLGGAFYNTKEMVLLPMLLCVGLWFAELLSLETLLYLLGGLAVLYVFAATLGLHAGITYANSGVAVATSLGTIFFLFVGVYVCMHIMRAFSGSFHAQFLPFFAFMVFGGVGLYAVLGVRNPSTAIGTASFLCPFATFYAITSYGLESPLAAFLVTAAAYGFTTAAMLVPAICEFDVATGRTTIEE